MKVLLRLVILIGIGCLVWGAIAYAGDCPSCDKNLPPLQGRESEGRPATIGGRPAVSVRIDGSWDTTPGHTSSRVWDAVNEGMRRWNDTTDGGGHASRYNFDLRQTDSGAQITIIKDPSIKGSKCGMTTGPPGGPYVIHLPDNADGRTLEALINTIEHELGHVYGLDHPDGACPGNQSIMKGNPGKKVNGKWDPCGGTSRSLTANDVQSANLVTSTPQGAPAGYCGYTWQYGPMDPPNLGGPTGYVQPNYYYYPVCYYFYEAKDYYTCVTIDGDRSCSYDSTRYFLEDIICF